MSVKTNATVSMHDQRGGHGQTKQHQQASVEGVLFGRDPFNPALEGEGVYKEGMNEEGELGARLRLRLGPTGRLQREGQHEFRAPNPQPFATSTVPATAHHVSLPFRPQSTTHPVSAPDTGGPNHRSIRWLGSVYPSRGGR